MNKKINLIIKRNIFFLFLFIIISLNCCNKDKTGQPSVQTKIEDTEEIIRTGSLVSTLNGIIGYDFERRAQLMDFINGKLEYKGKSFYEEDGYGFHGVKYSYNKNGKYLFVKETEWGGGGSSYESVTTYIFDTDLVKLVPLESIFINANSPNPSFHKLVIEYLLKADEFGWIEQEYLPKEKDPITDYGFNLFYSQNGIGLKWKNFAFAPMAAGSFEIVLPYSKAQDFLTQTGKEVFK